MGDVRGGHVGHGGACVARLGSCVLDCWGLTGLPVCSPGLPIPAASGPPRGSVPDLNPHSA